MKLIERLSFGGLCFKLGAMAALAQVPVFTTQPTSQAVAPNGAVILSASATSAQSISYQWRVNGADLQEGDQTNGGPAYPSYYRGTKSATLILDSWGAGGAVGQQTGTYVLVATNNSGSTTSSPVTVFVGDRPTLTATSPADSSVTAGASATFSVAPGGTPPFTYQWSKDGAVIAGATSSSLLINNSQSTNAGLYSVVVSNPRGPTASRAARLTVLPVPVAPIITIQPEAPANATIGGSVTLSVGVNAQQEYPVSWTWSKDFGAINNNASASTSTLRLNNLTVADSGMYVVLVRNAGGSVVSNEVVLRVTSTALPTWRMVNVSTRTQVGTGSNILVQGFVVSGSVSKQVVVRAIGPTLATFGVEGTLANPSLAIFQGATRLAENDDWGGGATLANAFTAVGAFQLPAASRDSAVLITLPPGAYTAQVSGVGGTTGVALVEVYETP